MRVMYFPNGSSIAFDHNEDGDPLMSDMHCPDCQQVHDYAEYTDCLRTMRRRSAMARWADALEELERTSPQIPVGMPEQASVPIRPNALGLYPQRMPEAMPPRPWDAAAPIPLGTEVGRLQLLGARISAGVEIFAPIVVTGDVSKLVIGAGSRIDSFVKIEVGKGVIIGKNTHIASFAHLNIGGGRLTIEKCCGIASGAKIVTGGNDVDSPAMTATAPINEQDTYTGEVYIGRYCSVLANAVMLPNTYMRRGSRLAAGAVLTKNGVSSGTIYAGIPARFLRGVRFKP